MIHRHLPVAVLALSYACGWAFAADSVDLTALDRLPAGASVRVEANSLASLIDKVRPRVLVNRTDMVWTGHDTKGALYFTVDRAFALRDADGTIRAALLRIPAESENAPMLTGEFLRESATLCRGKDDPNAAGHLRAFRLSRDNDLGTVYELDWQPRTASGPGEQILGRSILLLCNAAGKWSLIGEGPGALGYRGRPEGGARGRTCVQQSEYAVRWTGDPANPAVVTVTTFQTCYRPDLKQWGLEPVLTLRRDGVVSDGENKRVQWQGPLYVVAARGATVDAVAERLAVWGADYAAAAPARQDQILRSTRAALLRLNPRLSAGGLDAGTRVTIPDADDPTQSADAR